MKKALALLLVIAVVVIAALALFPRGAEAANSAILSVLLGRVESQHGTAAFAPALDGELLVPGDGVRSVSEGRAVMTFFDGSTVAADPGTEVRVVALARPGADGIQATLEQTIGRTWNAIERLRGDASSFEIKTPAATAVVRGTLFEVIVEMGPDGRTVTIVSVFDGQVLVRAAAGGEILLGPGDTVAIREGERAPSSPTPREPGAELIFRASAGVGITVFDPRGLACGAAARSAFGCGVTDGGSVTIFGAGAGTYVVLVTAAQAAEASVEAEGRRGDVSDFTAGFSRALATGDLVRAALPVSVAADGALSSSGFAEAEALTTICGAEASGRVFDSGPVLDRADALDGYAASQPGQPAAIVAGADELTAAVRDLEMGGVVGLSDATIAIDRSGVHLSATADVGFLSLPLRAAIVAGSVDGQLEARLRSIEAGWLTAVAMALAGPIEEVLRDVAQDFPLEVSRVALRDGCIAVIGTTR